MLRVACVTVAWLAVVLGGHAIGSGAQSAEEPAGYRSVARRAAVQKRRDWLIAQLAVGLRDAAQLAQLKDRLDRMSGDQIDQLYSHFLAKTESRRLQPDVVAGEQGEAHGVTEYPGRGGTGFVPVITWFPVGTSLTASALVSPDGRFVRVQAFPFFSTIGPVHTFNYYTGETRLLHPGPGNPFGHRHRPPKVWHDGLRTRP